MIPEVLSSLSALPHRYSTSDNEHRAADYLLEKLQEMGIEARLDPFVARTTFSTVYFILYLGFLAAAVIGAYYPLAGLALAVVTAVYFYGEQTTAFSPLSKWVPQGLSHNVVGRIPGKGRRKKQLFLIAHYDSSKTALIFHPRMAAGLRRATLFGMMMMALILAGSAARPFLPEHYREMLKWVLAFPAGYMAFLCLGMLEREVRGKPVNGANDNASGVAVVMELAKRVKGMGGFPGCDLTVLLTGAEETGMSGMFHFVRTQAGRLDPAESVFLNFDAVGSGGLCYIEREGMLRSVHADPGLLETAALAAASQERFSGITGRTFNALVCDSLVLSSRGYKVLCIQALTDAGVPHPWHWPNDIMENLDVDTVKLAAEFGWELTQRLAAVPDANGD